MPPTASDRTTSALPVLQGCATIQLTRGLNTLIDEADFPELSKTCWNAVASDHLFYAVRNFQRKGRWSHVLLHYAVFGEIPPGHQVDHRNRDNLDNRRDNLRLATPSSNKANCRKRHREGGVASKFKGVLAGWNGKWKARITKDGVQTHLGVFTSETDAARAYDAAAIEKFGEFATTNRDLYGDY